MVCGVRVHQLTQSPGAMIDALDTRIEGGDLGHPSETTARTYGWPGALRMSFASGGKHYQLRVPPGTTYGSAIEAFFMVHGLERLRPKKGQYVQNAIDLTKQLVQRANPKLLRQASSGVVRQAEKRKAQGLPTTVAAKSPGEAMSQASLRT